MMQKLVLQMMDVETRALAARQGDLAAFNDLVLAFQATAYNVAYRIAGDPDAAADATQEAFLKAYRSLKQYRGGSFKAWLLRIVANTCYDFLRARKRRPAESLSAGDRDPDYDGRRAARAESPEEYAAHRETIDRIQAAILRLPADLRLVLVLRDVEGMSYEEVAAIAGVPLGTVKSRINRARARVRHLLLASGELRPLPPARAVSLAGHPPPSAYPPAPGTMPHAAPGSAALVPGKGRR